MDPISFVLVMWFKLFMFVVRVFILLCKNGFFWLMAGYFVNYVMLDNPTSMQHFICMLVAWGGTFIHFFGRKTYTFMKSKIGSKESENNYNEYYE